MRSLWAIVIGLGCSLPAVVDAHRSELTQRYAKGGWAITVSEDRFSGSRRCALTSRGRAILYQPGAAGFRMKRRDTLDALYRIDDGPVVRWQDRYPSLIAAHVEVEGSGLDDPTDRIVWVPEAELRGARSIAIRTRARGWGDRFNLGGFDEMRDAVHGLACTIVVNR